MSEYSAAQIMVIATALRESENPQGDKSATKSLKAQPRVSRSVLLELARKNNADVQDMREHSDA
jgi:hypothetical protein